MSNYVESYRHLLAATFEPVEASAFSASVQAVMDEKRRKGMSRDYVPGSFVETLAINDSGLTTYIGQYLKIDNDGLSEEGICVVDTDTRDTVVGYGYVRMLQNPVLPYLQDLAHVGFTFTEEKALGNGIGMRRLFILNAASRLLLDGPLHSGQLPTMPARKHWLSLEASGYASHHLVGSYNRFYFTG